MSTSDPFGPPVVPGGTPLPERAGHDAWGHEVGGDVGHVLDPGGHARRQQDSLAHLVGEPEVIKVRSAGQRLAIQIGVVLVLVLIIAGAVLWLLANKHKL